MRVNLAELLDDFDLLLAGVIDSIGIFEMISAIEHEFQIKLDLGLLDAEDITRMGRWHDILQRMQNDDRNTRG
jgi:acyl carrier protein